MAIEMTCYCIIPDSSGTSVLLERASESWTLPKLGLPAQEIKFFPELVPYIRRELSSALGLELTVLRHVADNGAEQMCELEYHSGDVARNRGYAWVGADETETLQWDREDHRAAVVRLFDELGTESVPVSRAPWERRGWFDAAAEWFEDRLSGAGYRPVGPIEQLKGAWGWSSILLARTSSGKFFFKASYRKPPYEAVTVDELSRDWPNHVPRLVGVDRGRNWMIMHDFGETRLNELDDGYRRRAVRAFARLQEASSGLAEKWRGLGCNAAGPPGMIPDLERLLGETAILRCGPDALSDDEIESLIGAVPVLADRCVRLSDSSIPVTIHNEDFRSDNVVWHDNSFIFFDWSNTAVTHPFFSMNYFLNRMKRPDGTSSLRWKVLLEDPARQALRDAYLEAWHDYAGMDELRDEFSRVRGLFFLYEAIRCYRDLPYLEPDAPWTRNAVVYIPRCLRDLRDALELDGVR